MIARLRGYGELAALVGKQVYGGFAPQGADMPYLVVFRVSGAPLNTLSGPNSRGDHETRVQVDCVAARYQDVKTIADAARGALSGWSDSGARVTSCMLDNEIDDTESPQDESNVVAQRVVQDYIVFYQ